MPELAAPPVAFGVPGLDHVLRGGIPADSLFLIEGAPGSGKTTLGLHFLMEGARRGERCLLVSNAETPVQLRSIAAAHGWSLDGIEIAPWRDGSFGGEAGDYTLFPEAEVEVGETLAHLFEEVDRVRPARLVIDSISGLRVLAPTPAFYRRQLKRIRDALLERGCTTVLVDDAHGSDADTRAQTLAHGVLELSHVDFRYGADRRRLRVRKVRGAPYVSGSHDFTIETGGVVVYPRLVAIEHAQRTAAELAESGIAALDALAGGGLRRGTSTLLMGPAGCGKSTLAALYVHAAAQRGERSAVYLFDEGRDTYLSRSRGLGMEFGSHVEAGRVLIEHVDPAELTPAQIAHRVLRQVEDGVCVVAFDTLNGYLHSAVVEEGVLLHLRELLSYLSRRGVVALLTLTEHGVLGTDMATPMDLSFLADSVFMLRYFEAHGEIRKAVSMVKRRTGPHEHTIRELQLGPGGIGLSEPLRDFVGVMSGIPQYVGEPPARPGTS